MENVRLSPESSPPSPPRRRDQIMVYNPRHRRRKAFRAPLNLRHPPISRPQNSNLKHAKKLQEKAKNRDPSKTTKTIELNWAIDGNDLGHRLVRMKEFLEKGMRVEVVMAGKRKGRKASEEEGEALLGRVRGVVMEVEGAKEWKGMEGKVLAQATIYVEGKAQK